MARGWEPTPNVHLKEPALSTGSFATDPSLIQLNLYMRRREKLERVPLLATIVSSYFVCMKKHSRNPVDQCLNPLIHCYLPVKLNKWLNRKMLLCHRLH